MTTSKASMMLAKHALINALRAPFGVNLKELSLILHTSVHQGPLGPTERKDDKIFITVSTCDKVDNVGVSITYAKKIKGRDVYNTRTYNFRQRDSEYILLENTKYYGWSIKEEKVFNEGIRSANEDLTATALVTSVTNRVYQVCIDKSRDTPIWSIFVSCVLQKNVTDEEEKVMQCDFAFDSFEKKVIGEESVDDTVINVVDEEPQPPSTMTFIKSLIKRLYEETDLSQVINKKKFFLTVSHRIEDKRLLATTYYVYVTRQHLANKDAVNVTVYELAATGNDGLNIHEVKEGASYQLNKELLVTGIQSTPGRIQNRTSLEIQVFEVEETILRGRRYVFVRDSLNKTVEFDTGSSIQVPDSDPVNISFSFRPPHQPVFKPMKQQTTTITDPQLQPFPAPPEIFMNPRHVVAAPVLVADAVIVSIRHKITGEVKYLQRVDTFMNDHYRFVFNKHVATATRFPCKTQQESSMLVSTVKIIRPDHEDYLIFVHPA